MVEVDIDINCDGLRGTLLLPNQRTESRIVLIIAGSGPTDRDGNQPALQNNSLKLLATALCENGIATIRYDKRGVGDSKIPEFRETDLRIENYVNDAITVISYLRDDDRFSGVVVLGHSEGSLIGMLAAQDVKVEKFISVAGAGRCASELLITQLQRVEPDTLEASMHIVKILESGQAVEELPPALESLFRRSVQPYLMSWFKYNPAIEIQRLDIPVMIVQGTNDLQLTIKDAGLLLAGAKFPLKADIPDMNHVLKICSSDIGENIRSYNEPKLPVSSLLVTKVVNFIKDSEDA